MAIGGLILMHGWRPLWRGGAGRGRKAQRSMCPAYIAGLIGLDDRKSIQPMAARTSEIPYDRLQQSRSPSLPSSDL